MRRRHLRGVLRIEQQVYPRPWSLGLFMSELRLPAAAACYVVGPGRRDGRRLRRAACSSVDDGHVTTSPSTPTGTGRRIGTRLLLALARAAIERGAEALTLEVRVGNDAAQALYRRFGFAPAGVRKGYYARPNEDALDHVGQRRRHARLRRAARRASRPALPGPTTVEELGR